MQYPVKRMAKGKWFHPRCLTRSEVQTREVVLYPEASANNQTCLKKTCSGRICIEPLDWWMGERIEFSDDEVEDDGSKFLVKSIKRVIRV